MIDVGSWARVIEGAGALPYHQLHGYVPEPDESHRLFGAGFLFVGVLLLVETLAGGVWHRHQLRSLIWPGAVMFLGAGMLIVSAIEPSDRLIHFTIGLLMLAAGVVEARHRLGYISRGKADLLVVPALIAGALEIGVFHLHGSIGSHTARAHALLGLTVGAIALARLYQGRQLASMGRSSFMGVAVMLLGLELLAIWH